MEEAEEEEKAVVAVEAELASNVTKKDIWLENALMQLVMTDQEEEEPVVAAEENASNAVKKVTWQENAQMLMQVEEIVVEAEEEEEAVMMEDPVAVAVTASNVVKMVTSLENVLTKINQVNVLTRDKEEMMLVVPTEETVTMVATTTMTPVTMQAVVDGITPETQVAKLGTLAAVLDGTTTNHQNKLTMPGVLPQLQMLLNPKKKVDGATTTLPQAVETMVAVLGDSHND